MRFYKMINNFTFGTQIYLELINKQKVILHLCVTI